MKKLAVVTTALMVIALPIALPVVPSAAHTQAIVSAVDLTGASLSGSSATYSGAVASATSSCRSGRVVKVVYQSANGAVLVAKGKSSSSGAFSIAGIAPPTGKSVKAKATKKVLANSASHSHTCKAATSQSLTPTGGSGGGDGGGGGGSNPDEEIDLTKLPVGDDRYSSSPQVGYIYSCQTEFNGGGAFAQGPWFNGDGTWDFTKKEDVTVSGSVDWNHELTVTVEGSKRVIAANNLPDHPTGVFPIASSDDAYSYDRNPHGIEEQTVLLEVSANPTKLTTPECAGGQVGFMLSGGPLFNGFDAGGRDAVAWEVQDNCDGHPQATGVYHYHSLSRCVEGQSDGGHSDLLGYALDGFGLYGKYGTDGEVVTNGDLDACHGHTHSINWDGTSKSMYHYHMTYEFPYSVGCFRADAIQAGTGEGGGGMGGGTGGGGTQPPGGGGGGGMPPPGG